MSDLINWITSIQGFSYLGSTALFAYLFQWYYKNFYYPRFVGPLKDVPGPLNLFWLSMRNYYLSATGDPGNLYKELHEKYGPIVHCGVGQISVIDPEATKQIYSSYKFPKQKRYRHIHENVQNIFSTSDKKFHSLRKRMISPSFNMKNLLMMEKDLIAKHCVTTLASVISESIETSNGQVDFFDLYHKALLDVISDVVLGKCYDSLKKPSFPAHELTSISIIWGLKFTLPFLSSMKAKHHPLLKSVIQECIQERRSGVRRNDIFQALIDSQDSESGVKLTDEEVTEEAAMLLFGGVETSPSAIVWCTYELLKNPDVYKKLVDELVTHFPNKDSTITYEECHQLPYLNAVLYETLRLHAPAGSVSGREVSAGGATVCGYYLPEGTRVGTGAFAFHHSEQYWPECESFKPDRWLGPDSDYLKSVLFTFGMGPQGCVGKNLAWIELYITLSNLIRKFELSWDEDITLTPIQMFANKAKEEKLIVNVAYRQL